MSQLVGVLLALLLLGIGFPLSTAAAEEAVPAVVPAEEVGAKPEAPFADQSEAPLPAAETSIVEGVDEAPEEPVVDVVHKRISSGVLATSRWLDSFFADPRVESEEGETRIKVRFSLFAEEGSGFEYDVRANVRLDLPVLENRLQLLFAGDPEDDDDFQAITGREGAPPELADDENYSVSLRYFLKRTVYRHFSLRSGVRLRSGMPTLFLEPRYRQSVPFDHGLFRFTQRVIGLSDGTVRARTTLDLDRELRRNLLFRATADGTWIKDEDGYFYTLGLSVYQRLSPRRVLVYSWANSFVTHPNHRLEEVVLSTRYRQRIWRDWLFYEVAPQLSFPRDEDFETTPGIFLRLEMLFGDYPILPPEPERKKSAGE